MLTFNLKKEWFEKIKSGEKTHEYRKTKPYWDKRLFKILSKSVVKMKYNEQYNDFDGIFYPENEIICFKCGYPKKNNKDKILFARIISIFKDFDGNYSDLHINEPVYDIEFELIEGKYAR